MQIGDLIEIVYNPHFKIKGYLEKVVVRSYSDKTYIVTVRGFIDGKLHDCYVDSPSEIRYIGKVLNRIYCITNKVTGKQYIGRTSQSVGKRYRQHWHECDKYYSQTPLHIDMQKYGEDNFEVVELYSYYADRQKDANKIEQFFMIKYNTKYPNGYNIA